LRRLAKLDIKISCFYAILETGTIFAPVFFYSLTTGSSLMEVIKSMLKVFNTLTREKETFKSIEPGKVRMYVCGPTVYNYIHIGNARSAVAFDTIRRYLEFSGYQVDYISNFTDIGEKLARTATAENTTVAAVAAKYIAAVNEDSAALNIEPATYHPRARKILRKLLR
jgi:Cysteinyl-tRNA synthetase